MTKLQALKDLHDKVEAGDDLDRLSFQPFAEQGKIQDRQSVNAHRAFAGSLGAAKTLHDAVLPGWDWLLNSRSNYAIVWESKEVGDADAESMSIHGPARAWLLSILKALIAQEEAQA